MLSMFSFSNCRLKDLLVLAFSVRALQSVWLAFPVSLYGDFLSPALFLRVWSFRTLSYIALILGGIYVIKHRKVQTENLVYLVPLLTYFILLIFHTYDYAIWKEIVINGIFIICFSILRKKDIIHIFDSFYWILQVNNLVSCLLFLAFIFDVPIDFEKHFYYVDAFLDSSKRSYMRWSIFAIYYNSGGEVPRLCGIFNEPGGLGTLCALMFIARFPHMKFLEKVLLVLTIAFTFSLAGYLLLMGFMMIYLLRKSKKYVLLAMIPVLAMYVIPQIHWENPAMNRFASRFRIMNGNLAGDNRTNKQYEILYNDFVSSEDLLFGRGGGYRFPGQIIESSYKRYIVQFGIVGFLLILTSWLFSSRIVAHGNKQCWILFAFFVLSLYQRPNAILSLWGYVVLFGGMEWIKWKTCTTSQRGLLNE